MSIPRYDKKNYITSDLYDILITMMTFLATTHNNTNLSLQIIVICVCFPARLITRVNKRTSVATWWMEYFKVGINHYVATIIVWYNRRWHKSAWQGFQERYSTQMLNFTIQYFVIIEEWTLGNNIMPKNSF